MATNVTRETGNVVFLCGGDRNTPIHRSRPTSGDGEVVPSTMMLRSAQWSYTKNYGGCDVKYRVLPRLPLRDESS